MIVEAKGDFVSPDVKCKTSSPDATRDKNSGGLGSMVKPGRAGHDLGSPPSYLRKVMEPLEAPVTR